MHGIVLALAILVLSGCGRPNFHAGLIGGSVSALEDASSSGASNGSGPPSPSKAGTSAGSQATPAAGSGGTGGGGAGGGGTTGGNPGLIEVNAKNNDFAVGLCFSSIVSVPTPNANGGSSTSSDRISIGSLNLDSGLLILNVEDPTFDRVTANFPVAQINQPTFTLAAGCGGKGSATVTNGFGTYYSNDNIQFTFQGARFGSLEHPNLVEFPINFKPALDRLRTVMANGAPVDQAIHYHDPANYFSFPGL